MRRAIGCIAILGLAACVGSSVNFVWSNLGVIRGGIGMVIQLQNGKPAEQAQEELSYEAEENRIRLEELKYQKRPVVQLTNVSFVDWVDGKRYLQFTYKNNSSNRAFVRKISIETVNGSIVQSPPMGYPITGREIPPFGSVELIAAPDTDFYDKLKPQLTGFKPLKIAVSPDFVKFEEKEFQEINKISYYEAKAISAAVLINITSLANEDINIATLFWTYARNNK